MLCYTNLGNYYQLNFAMAEHHHWSIADIEGMFPYERELYVELIRDFHEQQAKESAK